jgi:radical SAM superfamily enzyme YgiQ (UPF0313 family)
MIRPPTLLPVGAVTSRLGVPSIGMAYINASLKAHGYEVMAIDAFGESVHQFSQLEGTNLLINGLNAEQIIDRIPVDIDFIGVSCMYSNEWIYSKIVINKIIERFPNVPVIGGGEHFTAEQEHSFATCPKLHSLVLGEGEETFLDLLDAILNERSLREVEGIAFMKDGQFVKTPMRRRLRKIDEIPNPSWDEMPLETYLNEGLGMSSVKGRNMPMIASRGCPYQCTFCSNPNMWTNLWISRNVDQVLQDIKDYIKRYNVNHIEFYDLTAIIRKSWIIEFCTKLIEADLKITWALPSGTRSEALDDEVVNLLHQSGCCALTYAPEAGSETTLKRIKKKVSLPKMLKSIQSSVNAGIVIKANMIIGFPGQTKWEVLESYWFMVKMAWFGTHDVAVFPFVPYPGSDLYKQLVNEGKINTDGEAYELFLAGNVYNDVEGMVSWSEHISNWQMSWLTIGGMAWFYGWQFLMRPWRLLGSIVRIVREKPVTMFDKTLYVFIQDFISKKRKRNLQVVETLK